jgi:hypothetical protein
MGAATLTPNDNDKKGGKEGPPVAPNQFVRGAR